MRVYKEEINSPSKVASILIKNYFSGLISRKENIAKR
jgi:hypothetical protein